MGFGSHRFTDLMKGQIRGGSVIAIDERRLGMSGNGRQSSFEEERARQDAMYAPKRH